MKVVMINGSFKRNGVTAGLLKEIEKKLNTKEVVQVEIVHLADYDLAYCSGCTMCYSKGQCALDKKDGFGQIRKAIEEADGVILGTPNYVSTVTGLFKTFIDRMDFVTGQVMFNKYVMTVTTYQNVRGNVVNRYVTEQSILAGGMVRGKINLRIDPYNKPYDYSAFEKKVAGQTEKFYQSMAMGDRRNVLERIYGFFTKRALRHCLEDEKHYAGLIKGWQAKGIL